MLTKFIKSCIRTISSPASRGLECIDFSTSRTMLSLSVQFNSGLLYLYKALLRKTKRQLLVSLTFADLIYVLSWPACSKRANKLASHPYLAMQSFHFLRILIFCVGIRGTTLLFSIFLIITTHKKLLYLTSGETYGKCKSLCSPPTPHPCVGGLLVLGMTAIIIRKFL